MSLLRPPQPPAPPVTVMAPPARTSTRAAARGIAWTLVAVARASTGPRWHYAAPLWVLALAPVSLAWDHATTAWAALAAAAAAIGRAWPGRGLSQREWYLTGTALLGVAAWTVVAGDVPARWAAALLALVVLGPAVPFWWWRRIRPTQPTDPASFLVRWDTEVVPALPQLAGEWLSWDDTKGTGVLELTRSRASLVVGLDEDVEQALGNVFRGAVTLAMDPRLPVRQVRVMLTGNPRAEISRVNHFDNPTLTEDGAIHLGDTRSGRTVIARIARPDGAGHGAITGGTGAGKGTLVRLIAAEAGLADWVWLTAVDGKTGAGIPEIRGFCDVYARDKDAWKAAIAMSTDLRLAREDRYGAAGWSSWSRATGDPLHMLLLDELPRLCKELPSRYLSQLEDYVALGRSLGLGLWADGQRFDAPSFISATARSNLLAGGAAYCGMPGDDTARRLAAQDFDVDPSRLPAQPGWIYALSKIDPDVPDEPFRFRFLPSRQQVQQQGVPAPFGVAEDWWALKKTARLHPQDAEIVARWAPELGLTTPDPVPDPVPAAPATVPATPAAVPPPAAAVPDDDTDVPGEPSTRTRMLALLDQAPATRGDLADQLGVTPRRISQLLRAELDRGRVTQDGDTWRGTP